MTINEIYSWLLKTDPDKCDAEMRSIWSNMASYCYFINAIDFDSIYQDQLKLVLDKSVAYNISVPDNSHEKVLRLAKIAPTEQMESCIKELLYE